VQFGVSTSGLGIADVDYFGLCQDPGTVRIMTGSRYVSTLRAYTNVAEHVEESGWCSARPTEVSDSLTEDRDRV